MNSHRYAHPFGGSWENRQINGATGGLKRVAFPMVEILLAQTKSTLHPTFFLFFGVWVEAIRWSTL